MYIRVEAIPNSKKEKITRNSPSKYKIEVKEPPSRNLANKRIQKILSEEFKVPVKQVKMLTGHRSSSKMYSIDN